MILRSKGMVACCDAVHRKGQVMRRTDREMNEIGEIIDVLHRGVTAQIALVDNHQPYIITMNYGFIREEGGMRLYFHSAGEGRKIQCIRKNPSACFTVAMGGPLVVGDKACGYAMEYRSVVGHGKIRIVDDPHEKKVGLNLLMKHYTGEADWDYDEETLGRTTVLCLDAEDMTGKRMG